MAAIPIATAKTKWCPAAPRTYGPDGSPQPHCVGDACMVWVGDGVSGSCGLPGAGGGGGASGADPTVANTWTARQTFDDELVIPARTVASLPIGAAAVDGLRSQVTDCTSGNFNGTVLGGGSTHVPVWYDASSASWRVG